MQNTFAGWATHLSTYSEWKPLNQNAPVSLKAPLLVYSSGQLTKACGLCGVQTVRVSSAIGVCVDCLRAKADEAVKAASRKHWFTRSRFGLPDAPPKDALGVSCNLCSAGCVVGEGSLGYCGIRGMKDGRFFSRSSPETALLHYYLDPHVTNCCSAWFCPAGTGAGYPRYACTNRAETGYYNLALFFYGCNFDCLFCQNWSHKVLSEAKRVRVEELVGLTLEDEKITCWCWFGGSPEPQLPFAVNASRRMLQSRPERRVVRVCYEWNGDGNPLLVKRAAETAFESGGNIKFDLKAFNPAIHKALTGRSNERVLENFEAVYRTFYEKRSGYPF